MAKKPVWVLPDGSTVGQKDLGKVKPTPKPKPKVTPTSKTTPKPTTKATVKATPKPSAKPTLPTLAEFKQSAAYKNGDWTYKQYVDFFKKKYGIK